MRLRHLGFAAQAVVTLALLALLLRNFDFASFSSIFGRIPFWFYVFSFSVLATGQALYTLKWQLILRAMGVQIPFQRLAEQYLIGIFFNNFLPTAIGGDAARVYYLGRREGYATVATSVLMDRALSFLSMAAWGTALAWWLQITTPAFVAAREALTAVLLGLVATLAGALIVRPQSLVRRLRRIRWLSPLGRALDLLSERGRPLRSRPGLVLAVLGIGFLYFLPLGWVYQTYFVVAGGPRIALQPMLLVLVAIAILSNLPVSVNGIGLREQLHYLLLGSLGVSKELAVGISVIIFSQFLLLSVLGCLAWIRVRARPSLTSVV